MCVYSSYVYVIEDQIYALADLIANQQQQASYKVLVFFPTARHTGFVADLFNRVHIYAHMLSSLLRI